MWPSGDVLRPSPGFQVNWVLLVERGEREGHVAVRGRPASIPGFPSELGATSGKRGEREGHVAVRGRPASTPGCSDFGRYTR